MSIKEIVVPDIGDFDSVEVIEILVAEGDMVQVEDSLITVESDKASMEIPSSESGKVVKLNLSIGDNIAEGSVILMMEVDENAKPADTATNTSQTQKTAPQKPAESVHEQMAPAKSTPAKSSPGKLPTNKPSPTAIIDEVRFSKAYASPSVRKFARELGVDLGKVEGTSRKGRINKNDVKVRVNIFKKYSTGDKKEDFIHVFANIMEGRTIEKKLNLSKTIVKDLALMFPLVPHIGTNVIEFERATYFNKNMLDPNYQFSMP